MTKLKLISLNLLLSLASTAFAAAPEFVIEQIRIDGLQRIEMGTVFSYLPVKIGDTLTAAKSDEIIHKLISTGFFQDIRIEEQGSTLIIDVEERPVITKLSISGDKEFDHDKLIKSLKENGLSDGLIFDQSILDNAILSLKNEYYNRGLYSVILTPSVTQLERNRVNISIAISEGATAKITGIAFTGNQIFSTKKLLKQM